jgi:murein L,D-transpeptidase YafK
VVGWRRWITFSVIAVAIFLLAPKIFYKDRPALQNEVDSLVVIKSERKMLAYQSGRLLKEYEISLGGSPIGHKQFEGDEKTPEGLYVINDKNASSAYHKNLGVSYPNEVDKQFAGKVGRSPGSDIKIHGLRNGLGLIAEWHRNIDWTQGCIAVTNAEIDELYQHVEVGTPINILP